MTDLAHQKRIVAVDALGESPKGFDYCVTAHVDLTVNRGDVTRDDRRTAEHREGDAAFRLLLVISLIPFARQAILGITGRMGGADDSIFHRFTAYRQRLEKRPQAVANRRLTHRVPLLPPYDARQSLSSLLHVREREAGARESGGLSVPVRARA